MKLSRFAATFLVFYLLTVVPVLAQGFAGLGSDAGGFALPQRGKALRFPADHGPHHDFRIEWWYLTANLQGTDGESYGVQWTLFRAALKPGEAEGWQSPQLWMGHAALTSRDSHLVAERVARGGIGQAGVRISPFEAHIDDWRMKSTAPADSDELSKLELRATGSDFSYRLQLEARSPLVLHGEGGYSVKSAQGQASHYYSQPFYKVSGVVSASQGDVEVSGEAWLDREWSSQPLAADQTGWDWFSLHFAAGNKLMGFRLRDGGPGFTSATWISADGKTEPQPPGALKVTPLQTARIAGREIPVRWRVELESKGVNVVTNPLNANAWMDTQVPYWEGPALFEGTHAGRGYIEMTGYE
jgi:predicted secreted hydrolase